MISRRTLLGRSAKTGFALASSSFWLSDLCSRAFGQSAGGYKALVVITLEGGNDSNNMLIPTDPATYAQYADVRTTVAIPEGQSLPLSGTTYGLHPSLKNVAALYNSGAAAVVANVGPLSAPLSKAQLLANPSLAPESLLSHPAGVAQWESATTLALPSTGWGGRLADMLSSQSGSLPPILNLGLASVFTVGQTVQGITLQQGGAPAFATLPPGIENAILVTAQSDSQSANELVAPVAQLRVAALQQQNLLAQAQAAGTGLKTAFPTSSLGQNMFAVAKIINGRSVVGATRQIFYLQLQGFDTHSGQLTPQASLLSDLDASIGSFMSALQEIGLQNQVMLCTHSDFNRTLVANVTNGTDHAWGTHQLVIGGGIKGGRIIGTVPEPELGGSSDLNGYGIWIPTLSVTQMVAGVGSWMGLSASQLATVFPDLPNFTQGQINFT